MYLIIGGDGKEYGPISGADLRRWVAEGRLSAQSMVKAESDAEFRTLSTFPEFADVFAVPAPEPGMAPMLATGGGGREAALDKVKVPAIGLMVSAILSLIIVVKSLVTILFFHPNIDDTISRIDQFYSSIGVTVDPQQQELMRTILHAWYGPVGIISNVFQVIIAVLILIGAKNMLKLRSFEFSYAAAILSVLPCINPCCGWILGLIFGFWAMAVLGKVKTYFT